MTNGVCAVIVTYNRKDKLLECLSRLRASTERPQGVLVVDNASSDGTAEMVRNLFPEASLIVLENNLGGAGGFDAGMRQAYASGYEYVWLFDDDAYVEPDCLRRLLLEAHRADVIVPIQIDQAGRKYGIYRWDNGFVEVDKSGSGLVEIEIFAFVGPLIKRRVIEQVGFIRVDFFICADDIEYSLRIRNAGLKVLCHLGAIFYHDYGGKTVNVSRLGRVSARSSQPAWKNYYSVRNDILIARSMNTSLADRVGLWLYLTKKFVRSSLGEFVYEKNFLQKWKYTLIGVWDGLLNRSGRRVTPVVK